MLQPAVTMVKDETYSHSKYSKWFSKEGELPAVQGDSAFTAHPGESHGTRPLSPRLKGLGARGGCSARLWGARGSEQHRVWPGSRAGWQQVNVGLPARSALPLGATPPCSQRWCSQHWWRPGQSLEESGAGEGEQQSGLAERSRALNRRGLSAIPARPTACLRPKADCGRRPRSSVGRAPS